MLPQIRGVVKTRRQNIGWELIPLRKLRTVILQSIRKQLLLKFMSYVLRKGKTAALSLKSVKCKYTSYYENMLNSAIGISVISEMYQKLLIRHHSNSYDVALPVQLTWNNFQLTWNNFSLLLWCSYGLLACKNILVGIIIN